MKNLNQKETSEPKKETKIIKKNPFSNKQNGDFLT